MDASNDILFNASALHSLKRQQLTVLCKRYKVKASGKNDDIVARLQAYGQSLIEDSKSLRTQDSSDRCLASKGDETPRAEDETTGRATADASSDMTPNATIRVPELTLRVSSRDCTDLKRPSQQWEVVEGEDEAEFGELKAAGTAESILSKSTAPRALIVGSASGKSSQSSTSKGSVISSGIMSIAKSIRSVASKTPFKSSGLGSNSQSAHYVLARSTTLSAQTDGSTVSGEQQFSAFDPTANNHRNSLNEPIMESKVDAASANDGEATIRLVTTPAGGPPLVGAGPVATKETMVEATEEGPMDVDLSSTSLSGPATKRTTQPAFVFGSPTAGVSNTQFGNAAALVLEEMNRRLGVSSGGAKITEDGGKVEFGVLPGLNVDVSKTLEKLRVGRKDEGRFASAHEKEFAKMDSIANHYSVRHPSEKMAGKKRKSMEGASHHDTLVPLKAHSAKDGPTTKRQKTGDAPSLRRTASTLKGKELPPKSHEKGSQLKKTQRERERRRSSRVGGTRRPFVASPFVGKPVVAASTSGKLGLFKSGAAKIRGMLGGASAVPPTTAAGTAKPALAKTKAKEMVTTCAPPTSTEVPATMKDRISSSAEPKERKTPGPTPQPDTAVSKASSLSIAAKRIVQPTSSVPRKLAMHLTTSQIPSDSAGGSGMVKRSASNSQQRGTFDKADTPTQTEVLTVDRPIVAPGTQASMPSASSDASDATVNAAVSTPKKTVRLTPRSQRASRLYTPTASSLARMAVTNAKYRTSRVLSPGGASKFSLDIVQEKVDVPSPTKTTAEFNSVTRASTTPTHVLSRIASKTPYTPLSLTPANNSTAVEADGVSPIPSPPAQLSKTNTLIPRKARSPLSQANRPHISRSKVIAKVEEQRAAAATAAGTSGSPGTPGKMLRKNVAAGAGTVAKAAAMGETPQEHKGVRVQEAFDRRVRLNEAAIRRSRIGQMPIV